MENVREIVLDTLLTLERDGGLSHQLIRGVLNKYDYLDPRDKKYIKRVTEGTLERRLELDHYLDHYSSVPVRKMKPLIRCLLRMSVYQLLYMDAIPDSAVCNEACKLAEKRKFHALKGYVNGVLRKIAREKENLPMPDRAQDPLTWLCVKYSMPMEITSAWMKLYGEACTERLLQALLEIHPVSLRVSQTLSDEEKEDLKGRLLEAEIEVTQSDYDDRVFLARDLEGLESLPDFQEGRITVQDVSSVLAVKQAGIKEGDLVVDACASPGGKSILASELTGDGGKVICGDVSEKKTASIMENIDRMGRTNIEVRIWDARSLPQELYGKADVLLLDVPCSGLGVMGKKRDIKYNVTQEGLAEVTALQREILGEAYKVVKPGGILLYSTCTIREEENRDAVKWILATLPFDPMPLETMTEAVKNAILQEKQERKAKSEPWDDCCAQLLPGIINADGFFFAKLRRRVDD